MKEISLHTANIEKYKITYRYSIGEELKRYFNLNNPLFAEYDINISDVPQSVAAIPFVVEMLPVIWITDSTLSLPELDSDFYESINKFKQGFVDMYPMITFAGTVKVDKIVKNTYDPINSSVILFGGGVDAFGSLIAHLEEKPELLTFWGADVDLDNTKAWEKVWNHTCATAEKLGLKHGCIKTNFRTFTNQETLRELIRVADEEWYHGFQHAISMVGHTAPYTYCRRIKKVYIGSSFTSKERLSCGSDRSIDGNMRFNGVVVVHDQYEVTRQDKIAEICKYVKQSGNSLYLRVCWASREGENCCKCEKCYRTIFALLAENADPRDFGFPVTEQDIHSIITLIKRKLNLSSHVMIFWRDIQRRFIQNKEIVGNREALQWMMKYNFDTMNNYYRKRLVRLYVSLCIWYKKLKGNKNV